MKKKHESSSKEERQCLRITQFSYKDANINSRHRGGRSSERIPIKILVEKMSSTLGMQNSISQSQAFLSHKQPDTLYRNFLAPRDSTYIPKPMIFNRYNYENYNNYQYKNPYKPQKLQIQDRIMGNPRNNPTHGTDKNLEIVFCEHKYQDFVRKSNEEISMFYDNKRSKSVANIDQEKKHRQKAAKSIVLDRKQSQQGKLKVKSLGKRKTTLSAYLQQFNILQKLSNYMEREHKLNEKFFFNVQAENSRTVLLDIVIHRFEFLKNLKKKPRDLIFKTILGVQQLDQYYKINIHEYMKFIQIFVSRDSDAVDTSMFMFAYFFKNTEELSMQSVTKNLSMLNGSANMHSFIQQRISRIMKSNDFIGRKIFAAFEADEVLQRSFIDLILNSK